MATTNAHEAGETWKAIWECDHRRSLWARRGLTGLGAQLLGLLILWLWAKRRAALDLPPMESGT